MKERQRWIDVAKGICMLAVVACHTDSERFGVVFSFNLTVFFILAGYTLRQEPITPGYVRKKFTRMMVPYFITCAAVIAMDMVNAMVVNRSYSILDVTKILYSGALKTFFASGGQRYMGSIDLGKGIGAIWFLPAMFFSLLITQFLMNGIVSEKRRVLAAVAISAVSAASAQIIWLPFSIQAGAFSIPFVLLGTYLKEQQVLEEKLKWWHYLVFAGIFVLGCLSGHAKGFYMVSCYMSNWLITPMCAICSSLMIIGISRWIGKCKLLEFIGRNSMIVLCVHLFEMNTLYALYREIFEWLGIAENKFIKLGMRIILICVITLLLAGWNTTKKQKNNLQAGSRRDQSIDLMRALLIVIMIIGHNQIDRGLRNIIYSFHMMAFIMISGYFYKSDIPFRQNLMKTIKSLLPYGAFAILYVLVSEKGLLTKLKILAAGISYTKKVLTDIPTVGPVYFILLLFVTKMIYIFVDMCKKDATKNIIILLLFIVGLYLGNVGFWLPWSADCALFCLLFYHIAHYMRKNQVLELCKENPWLYFPLICIYAYMLWCGPMEISVRRYMDPGVTLLGVCSIFIILYMMCSYLHSSLPYWMTKVFTLVGQSTAHILVIHCLFSNKINLFLANDLALNSANIFHMAISTAVQVLLGTASFLTVSTLRKRTKNIKILL